MGRISSIRRFQAWYEETLSEVAEAVSFVVVSSTDFPDPASDVPIVEDKLFEKDLPWDLRELTSKDDHGLSDLRRTQELRQNYGSLVLL